MLTKRSGQSYDTQHELAVSSTESKPDFRDVKRQLRDLESEWNVTPAAFDQEMKGGHEYWHISFDKLVLYECDKNQDESYEFKAETPLNCGLHADLLKQILEVDFPSVKFTVNVTPKAKTFPIPGVEIPVKIPITDDDLFIARKSPNKVRGNNFLATLPTEITITACENLETIKASALWASLNKIACFHTHNSKNSDGEIKVIATDYSARASKNPVRWLASGMSYALNFVSPKALSDLLPRYIKRMGRLRPYGYPDAHKVMDTPVINSGAMATTVNATTTAVVIGGLALVAASECKKGTRTTESTVGFVLGSNSAPPGGSLGRAIIGPALANNTAEGTFANGYGQGLLFSQTLDVASDLSKCSHMPFATRTVIRPK